jgi:hypothetical protein
MREVRKHLDQMTPPLQAARQFYDLPLRATGPEVINDQQQFQAALASHA